MATFWPSPAGRFFRRYRPLDYSGGGGGPIFGEPDPARLPRYGKIFYSEGRGLENAA